jgi:dihydrofolate reductase
MNQKSLAPTIHIIIAVGSDGVFGWNAPEGKTMPWGYVREDFEFFKNLTVGEGDFSNAVIMGYNTWASLPKKYKPLPDRFNIVIDTHGDGDTADHGCDNLIFVRNLDSAFGCVQDRCFKKVFLIGGKNAIFNYLASSRAISNLNSLYVNIISTNGVYMDQSRDIPSLENCVYFPEILKPVEHFPELKFRLENVSSIPCIRKDVTLLSCEYTRQLQ